MMSALGLRDSGSPCLPLRAARRTPKGVQRVATSTGGSCTCCGLEVSRGLERHGADLLCPFCHMTQHLREASRLKAGSLVWVPGISQAELTSLQIAYFMIRSAPAEHQDALRSACIALGNTIIPKLYQAGRNALFEILEINQWRPEEVQGSTIDLDPFDPAILIAAIEQSERKAVRDEGLRLFFRPEPFQHVLKAWREDFFTAERVESLAHMGVSADTQEATSEASA